jgi:hypothetical protein
VHSPLSGVMPWNTLHHHTVSCIRMSSRRVLNHDIEEGSAATSHSILPRPPPTYGRMWEGWTALLWRGGLLDHQGRDPLQDYWLLSSSVTVRLEEHSALDALALVPLQQPSLIAATLRLKVLLFRA